MKLSMGELLGVPVHDTTGGCLGTVRDVWLSANDQSETFEGRVEAMVVSPPYAAGCIGLLLGTLGRQRRPA
jgi:sporulation protein YlmC with PRC-barrel domain